MRYLIAFAFVLAALSGCTRPAGTMCHVVESAPVNDVEWDAQCTVEHLGFPSELTLTLPDNTWVTVAYAPSTRPPFLSFTAGWGRGNWRCPALREPDSWVSEVEGKDTTVYTIAFFCNDSDPEHAIALAVEYPNGGGDQ